MRRYLFLILGKIYFIFGNISHNFYVSYFKCIYKTQLNIASNVSFGRGLEFTISPTECSLVIKKGVTFRRNAKILVINKGNLRIGYNSFFNSSASINCQKNITIGNDCLFGENVCIYDHNHKFRLRNTLIKEQGYTEGAILIGNNVWVGSNVTILKSVTIGNNCIIGAGCVISENIPTNHIVKNNFTSNNQLIPIHA